MNFEILNMTLSARNTHECKRVQYIVSKLVEFTPINLDKIRFVASADISYSSNIGIGAMVIMDIKMMEIVETIITKSNIGFAYISGFLAFREVPIIIDLINKSTCQFDLFLADGHGIAHPRRAGIASHIGVIIEKPTIGCAKSVLYGKYEEPPNLVGRFSEIKDQMTNDIIGAAVRTKINTRPLFISVGHMIKLDQSIDIVLKLSQNSKQRLPLPNYIADKISKTEKRKLSSS